MVLPDRRGPRGGLCRCGGAAKRARASDENFQPRFRHATGQLHKGDAGNGRFVQFTANASREGPIPDETGSPESASTFGVLVAAQAMGDRQALLDAGRRVIRFDLGDDIAGGLAILAGAIG